MHYFISAGEASGDIHASHLIKSIKDIDIDARFTFLGGDLMAKAAGNAPIIDYRRMAYMGFSEVLRHLPDIFGNLKRAKKALKSSKADALILVDYPSFNLKLAKYAKKLNIPAYYYISPKVWAWKEWRVKQLKRYIRRIYSILPFETEFFKRHDIAIDYVGNPSMEEVDRKLTSCMSAEEFKRTHHLDHRPILALIPGSRHGEIRNNLPIMAAVATRHKDMQPVIAAAPGIEPEYYSSYSSLPIICNDTFTLMNIAEAALVTSGTATLECALTGTPQVACYRANGSRLSYNIMKHLIKIPFVTLPNLIAGHEVIPEMLVHLCTVDAVDRKLREILPGTEGRTRQLYGYREMRRRLGATAAAPTAARLLYNDILNQSSRNEHIAI